MDTNRLIDLMEDALTRQQKTNSAADTKVSTLIGINTTMLAVLAALITRVGQASPWMVFFVVLSAGGLLTGILFLSLSSVPRTSRTTSSVIFFGSIASMSSEAFRDAMRGISPEDYLNDLLEQIHRTSEIATAKYRWIQRAQLAWYWSIVPWLITVYELAK
jgi:hypothetical protein